MKTLRRGALAYVAALYGENIGYAWSTGGSLWSDDDMMNWWMNSPGHRANILDPGYTEVGVSVVDRVSHDGTTAYRYWCVDFGAR